MKKILLYLVATAFVAVQAGASIITWGSPTFMAGGDGTSDMYTVGTLVDSINATGSAVTVAGVSFNRARSSAITLNGQRHGTFQSSSATPSLDTDYLNLLNPGRYRVSLIGLNNLTIGQEYGVQLWSSDSRDLAAVANRFTTLTAGNAVTLLQNNGQHTLGQWVVGIFTADATSQTISVSSSATVNAVMNAIQLRSIPEAASVGMITLGAGLLLAFRRFFQK